MGKAGGKRPGTVAISHTGNGGAPRGTHRETVKGFRDALNDGGERPSILLLKLMRGEEVVQMIDGEQQKFRASFSERLHIAQHLVQYELPRLASIEADITTTQKTHEDWVKELAAEGEDAEGKMLQ